jgi:hypothetical protein
VRRRRTNRLPTWQVTSAVCAVWRPQFAFIGEVEDPGESQSIFFSGPAKEDLVQLHGRSSGIIIRVEMKGLSGMEGMAGMDAAGSK